MACPIHKIDSNITGLSYAEEVCLKQLPTIALDAHDPVWYGLEPNSYSDFGGELSTVARAPIDPSRQNKKGTVTDLDASGGFNSDFTKTNLLRLMQGFFFADARQVASNAPIASYLVNVITDVTVGSYVMIAGGDVFSTDMIIYASGFSNPANNGKKTVTASAAGSVDVAETLVLETPPTTATIDFAGRTTAPSTLEIQVTAGVVSLVSVGGPDWTTWPELFPGRWIFIGGDTLATNRFANNVGYARISSVSESTLTFDDITWPTPVAETGTGKSIEIYSGVCIKNEKVASLIKRRSYNIERTLGSGVNGIQAEYLEGAVPNEFTLNIPQADKLNADLSFVACDNTQRSGDVGDTIKGGARVSARGEDAYNTSSDIYRVKMHVHAATTVKPELFGYVSEATLTVNNNVSPNKAVGILGAFDQTAGNFEVSGSITAYFTTVAAVKAVRQNADVGLSVIAAARNGGFIFDIPLLGLGGGRLNVEKDAPIMVPLEPAGAENINGYTMLYQVFPYLPTVAMPH